MLTEAAEKAVGTRTGKSMDLWLLDNFAEVSELTAAKRAAFVGWKEKPADGAAHARYKRVKSKVRREMRRLANQWWTNKSQEMDETQEVHVSFDVF